MSFEPFSIPGDVGARRRLVRSTLGVESRRFARGLTRRWRGPLAEGSSGVGELLREWSAQQPTLPQCLGFPLQHFRGWLRDGGEALWPAAAAAAHLCAHGRAARWSATLPAPRRLCWGPLVTPPGVELAVELDGDAPVLTVGESGGRATSAGLRGPAPEGWLGGRSAPTAHGALHVVAVTDRDLRPFDDGLEPSASSATEAASVLRDALAVMADYAPDYRSWVEDAVRCVVPMPLLPGGLSQSRSVKGMPGVVFAAFPLDPVTVAEALVHESSHQYLHYAERVSPPANDLDERLYYSPYPRRERRIGMILVAYHAFVNVALFYRACLEAGAPFVEACERNLELHLPLLEELDGYLRESPGLTATGRSLWAPASAELLGRPPEAEGAGTGTDAAREVTAAD